MRICRTWAVSIAVSTLLTGSVVSAEKQFTLIAPNIALANDGMSAEIRSRTWKTAEKTWAPTAADALSAVAHLKSAHGRKEILSCGGVDANMDASLKRIHSSRYQVFGLIITGRKQLLIEASPMKSSFDRYLPELWLKEIVSIRVLDGGSGYWWALYDSDSARVVSCNRRPN